METPASELHKFYEKMLALVRHARAAPRGVSDRVVLDEWADAAAYVGDVVVESTIKSPFWFPSIDHFSAAAWRFFKKTHVDGDESIVFRAGQHLRMTYWDDMTAVVVTDPAVIAVARLQKCEITNAIAGELDDEDWDDDEGAGELDDEDWDNDDEDGALPLPAPKAAKCVP